MAWLYIVLTIISSIILAFHITIMIYLILPEYGRAIFERLIMLGTNITGAIIAWRFINKQL